MTFLDSMGMGLLLRVGRAAVDAGCAVRVVGAPPHIYRIPEICGLVGFLGLAALD